MFNKIKWCTYIIYLNQNYMQNALSALIIILTISMCKLLTRKRMNVGKFCKIKYWQTNRQILLIQMKI